MQHVSRTIKVILIPSIVIMLLMAGSNGCSLYLLQSLEGTGDAPAESGQLVVNINDSGVKTLAPPLSMTPETYRVSGTDGNGGSFAEDTTASALTVPNLAFGEWTITVDALNEDGTIIGRGRDTVTVNSGETTSVNIVVTELDGYGTLTLSLVWPAADTQNPSVQGRLIPAAGSAIDLSFTLPSPGTANGTQTDIPRGYYTLELQLLDNDVSVAGAAEIVRIVADQTTSGDFQFTEINTPGGEVTVGITPEIHDPIPLTLSGQTADIAAGESMTVTASVPPDAGAVTYSWYLNSGFLGSGSSCTVGADLSEGSYRLDVTVISSDGSRAGSAGCTFQVSAPVLTQATLEWDANTEPDLAGYKLYCGAASGSYDTVIDVGNSTTYTLTDLPAGRTYYIAATAYNTAGLESGYSNEVVFDASS